MNLTDDELALRRALHDAVAGSTAPRPGAVEALDRAVIAGRRRRIATRATTVVSTTAALAVVVGVSWSFLPSTTPSPPAGSTAAGPASSRSASPTPPPSAAPTSLPGTQGYGSSGVANSAWPTAPWLERVARNVVHAGGGTVISTTPSVDYYEPPLRYDAAGRPVWAAGSHLRQRSVELAISTPRGDYLVDVTIAGNNPKGPDGEANQAYFPTTFDMSTDTPGTSTLVSEKTRKVFAYSNKAFAERKTLQAMVWRPDSLLLTVAVINYGVETSGSKKPVGPSWAQLGLTPQDLLDAAATTR